VVGEERDSPDRKSNKSKRQQADDYSIAAKLTPRHRPCGCVEERRKKDDEDDVGIERDTRHMWQEADDEARQHEDDRVRHLQPPCHRRKACDEDQQEQDDRFNSMQTRSSFHYIPRSSLRP